MFPHSRLLVVLFTLRSENKLFRQDTDGGGEDAANLNTKVVSCCDCDDSSWDDDDVLVLIFCRRSKVDDLFLRRVLVVADRYGYALVIMICVWGELLGDLMMTMKIE